MKQVLIVLFIMIFARAGVAVEPGEKIVFEGKGAGEVVFDGAVHAKAGLTCAGCHEPVGFTPALFERKRGESWITMKKIERGRSCGYCHEVKLNDSSSCGICHHKE